jgi:glutaredoxin
MILVGKEDCPTCKIVKKFLPDIRYIELNGERSTSEVLKIKKALLKLNSSKNLPVIFDDELEKMVGTLFILDNLNVEKIENELQKQ